MVDPAIARFSVHGRGLIVGCPSIILLHVRLCSDVHNCMCMRLPCIIHCLGHVDRVFGPIACKVGRTVG